MFSNLNDDMYSGEDYVLMNDEEPRSNKPKKIKPLWGYPITRPLFWAILICVIAASKYILEWLAIYGYLSYELYIKIKGGIPLILGVTVYIIWAFAGGRKAARVKSREEIWEEQTAPRSPQQKFDFEYPFTKILFWLAFSLAMAGTKLLLNWVPVGNSALVRLLIKVIPLIVGMAVYLIWAFAGRNKNIPEAVKINKMTFLEACGSVLTDKLFWISWALTASAFEICFDWGIIGNVFWLIVMSALFVDGKTGRR
ncbi:MAG: hypothetical protein Q4E74_01700 [Ruminococcus sp.]|nr:hypothetical protein [Ruminococcus sp.]